MLLRPDSSTRPCRHFRLQNRDVRKHQTAFRNAKSFGQARGLLYRRLYRHALPIPVDGERDQGQYRGGQAAVWRELIDLELSNREQLPQTAYIARMDYTFTQATMNMPHAAHLWCVAC